MERVELKRLTREQSMDFLRRGFTEAGEGFDERVLELAVDRLDGVIGWLSYFGLTAIRDGLSERMVDYVVDEASRIMVNEFSDFVRKRGSERYLWVMKAAKGGASWSEVKSFLELRTGDKLYDSELSKLLKNLVDVGFLAKDGEKYVIADPVLIRAIERIERIQIH